MKVASWDIQSDRVRLHTNQELVNRRWRVVLWAQGEGDAEPDTVTLNNKQRCNLADIAQLAADELLKLAKEKEPLIAAGWRVELMR